MAKVTILNDEVLYTYNAFNLIISYAFAIAIALLAGLAGLLAALSNGVIHVNSFSALVATSRNRMLDALFAGQTLGAHPMSAEVLDRKLRFGQLNGGPNVNNLVIRHQGNTDVHAAFGEDDEISAFRRTGK